MKTFEITDSQILNPIVISTNEDILINFHNTIEKELTINVLSNLSITITENNPNNVIINLNVGSDSFINYQCFNDIESSIKRTITMEENANVKGLAIFNNNVIDETNVSLTGENSNIDINVLSISKNNDIKVNTKINHLNKHTSSNIFNIGVAINGGNVLFNTIGKIDKGFSKSECRQLSKGIIMGKKSSVTSRPVLLIDEYDVKAYHGASIGKMSDDELFYLMSRGLTKAEAFTLILDGLVTPILNNVKNEEIKQKLIDSIKKING